jgi:hypothetical protein
MAERVTGVREVQQLLQQVDKVAAKVITGSSKAGARIALNYAKAHCPTSIKGKTGPYAHAPGNLKKSLKMTLEKRKNGKRVYQIGGTGHYDSGWYAHFVDYGFTDKSGVFHQGNKFLRNAIDLNRGVINQAILQNLADGLRGVT